MAPADVQGSGACHQLSVFHQSSEATPFSTSAATPRHLPRPQQQRRLLPRPATMNFVLLIFSFLLLTRCDAQDPVADFCRIWGHQTAVVDNRLFIDGGYVNWAPIASDPRNLSNQWFMYYDLDNNAANGLPALTNNLIQNSSVPDVAGGALWADTINKRVYLFGGEVDLTLQAPPVDFKLWAYDVLNDHWDNLGPPSSTVQIPSFGGNVAVPEHGLGIYYGGHVGNNTMSGFTGTSHAQSEIILYNMDNQEWDTRPGPDGNGRAEGVLLYIPAGDNGLLIYFGGIVDQYGNGSVTAQPMNEIFLYDFTASKWYSQNATGDIPDNRRRFCAGVAWASDFSSYNVYLYGGISILPNGTSFDDVWVLTMPTFQWFRWYPAAGIQNGDFPHHSLTCNVVRGGSQMIIVGGYFPTSNQCDAPQMRGAHDLWLGKQNAKGAIWETYNDTIDSYEVPADIYKLVGGNGKGGATSTVPAAGTFQAPDLAVLMTRTASASTRTATRDVTPGNNSRNSLSTGAIVGIAIGGSAALIAALILACICIKRHRKNKLTTDANGNMTGTGLSPNSRPDFIAGAPWTSPGDSSATAATSSHTPSSAGPYSPWISAASQRARPSASPYQPPQELPVGNMNQGVFEDRSGVSRSDTILAPGSSTGGSFLAKGAYPTTDPDVVLVPMQIHRNSSQSGYTAGTGIGGYVYSAGGYMASPTSPGYQLAPQRPMSPQELASEREDRAAADRYDEDCGSTDRPRGVWREGERRHDTYYHP